MVRPRASLPKGTELTVYDATTITKLINRSCPGVERLPAVVLARGVLERALVAGVPGVHRVSSRAARLESPRRKVAVPLAYIAAVAVHATGVAGAKPLPIAPPMRSVAAWMRPLYFLLRKCFLRTAPSAAATRA